MLRFEKLTKPIIPEANNQNAAGTGTGANARAWIPEYGRPLFELTVRLEDQASQQLIHPINYAWLWYCQIHSKEYRSKGLLFHGGQVKLHHLQVQYHP